LLLFLVFGVFVYSLYFFASKLSDAALNKVDSLSIIALPVVMSGSYFVFVLFLQSKLLINLLMAVLIIFIYLYFLSVYYFLDLGMNNDTKKGYSLFNLTQYGGFFTFYLAASGIYGLQSFVATPTWLNILIIVLINGLLFYTMLWTNKRSLTDGLNVIILSSLVIMEIGWSLSFLSFKHTILGLLLSLCYYVLNGLSWNYYIGNLNEVLIKKYLTFVIPAIIIILLTSQWL